MISKISIALLSLVLAGCMGPSLETRKKTFQQTMDSWVGHDINVYMRSSGYSTSSSRLSNGNTIYVFQRSSTGQRPTYTTPITTTVTPNYYGGATATTTGGQVYGGGSITYWCTKYFETDPTGRIVFWRVDGNNCY